jgi:hypothetical protein
LLKGKEWIAAKQGYSVKSDKIIVGAILGGLLALYTVLIYSFVSAQSGEANLVYVLLVAIPPALLVLRYPKLALFLIAVLIYVLRWMYDTLHVLPREITYVPDILIAIMVVRTLPHLLRRPEGRRRTVTLVMVLVAFAMLSGILNSVGTKPMIAGMRLAFQYVLLFIAAQYLNLSKGQIKAFLALLFVIGLAQTPITLYQSQQLKLFFDEVSGTFGVGQTPGIALFLLVLLSYLGARLIETSRSRTIFFLAVGWMTVCPILGSAKFYFLMLPVLFVFMLRAELFRHPRITIAMFVTAAALFFAGDRLAATAGSEYDDFRPLKLLEKIPEYFSHDMQVAEFGTFERSFQIVSAIRIAAASPRRVLIGYGPGSATESLFSVNTSSAAYFAANWGLTSQRAMPALWLLIEYGYFGLGLIFCLLWMIYRRGKILRASEDVDMRIYGRMLQNIVVMYVMWMFYQSAWQSDAMAYIFWAPAGIFVGCSYMEEARQRAAKQQAAASATANGEARPAVLSA